MIRIPFLDTDNYLFPPISTALTEPDGLLAGGGDLSPQRLLSAYRNGIFPWYQDGQPILWWSPSIRALMRPEHLKISRSLRKTLRNDKFTVTADTAFEQVITACAAPRPNADGTWITEEMQQAYLELHKLGYAHSIETWQNGELVGGLYGLAIGRCYFGESMFSRQTDASKVAFVFLIKHLEYWGFSLIDCQMMNKHLASLGASPLPRNEFIILLKKNLPPLSNTDGIINTRWTLESSVNETIRQPNCPTLSAQQIVGN